MHRTKTLRRINREDRLPVEALGKGLERQARRDVERARGQRHVVDRLGCAGRVNRKIRTGVKVGQEVDSRDFDSVARLGQFRPAIHAFGCDAEVGVDARFHQGEGVGNAKALDAIDRHHQAIAIDADPGRADLPHHAQRQRTRAFHFHIIARRQRAFPDRLFHTRGVEDQPLRLGRTEIVQRDADGIEPGETDLLVHTQRAVSPRSVDVQRPLNLPGVELNVREGNSQHRFLIQLDVEPTVTHQERKFTQSTHQTEVDLAHRVDGKIRAGFEFDTGDFTCLAGGVHPQEERLLRRERQGDAADLQPVGRPASLNVHGANQAAAIDAETTRLREAHQLTHSRQVHDKFGLTGKLHHPGRIHLDGERTDHIGDAKAQRGLKFDAAIDSGLQIKARHGPRLIRGVESQIERRVTIQFESELLQLDRVEVEFKGRRHSLLINRETAHRAEGEEGQVVPHGD